MLYFDNAATTYPKPEQVYKEMDRLTRECAVNSGRGSYKKAENASAVINETRKKVSEFMGAENAEDVIFTSSATEAANRVLRGYGFEENMTAYSLRHLEFVLQIPLSDHKLQVTIVFCR